MSKDSTLLPPCPLCDTAIEVYDDAVIYVEDGYKALAHEDCVVSLDEDDEFDYDDDLESLSDYDPEDDDLEEDEDF